MSPLYDQVFTAQWPIFAVRMALNLGGTKEFAAIDSGRFRELARRLKENPDEAEEIVTQAIAEAAAAWAQLRDHPAVSPVYRAALQRHWRKVPILQPHALLT